MNVKLATCGLLTLVVSGAIVASPFIDRADAQSQCPRLTSQTRNSAPVDRGLTTEIDRTFIEMMIPHHQGANEMAQMALERAKNPKVKELAQSIITEQTGEIDRMRNWYGQWYGTEVPTMSASMQGHMDRAMMMSMMQQEQMDREMMAALRNADDFDAEFLRQMTRHHQMATMMAGMVVNSAKHPETRELARSIIQSQNAEIAHMQQLLAQVTQQ
ncbi:MAG: DUF305 domain-containing protein [Cyanosarcina radialis HA8281-LM2]|jgi:uncharacterized protein (DUF305 family)|nr:DUF305 domain-containing protein [Cyanosarcina radialis HA8281-LM2]